MHIAYNEKNRKSSRSLAFVIILCFMFLATNIVMNFTRHDKPLNGTLESRSTGFWLQMYGTFTMLRVYLIRYSVSTENAEKSSLNE